MDPALKSMLHDEIQIAPYVSQDAYGAPVYGPPVTYECRIERRFQTQPSTTGAQLTEETIIFLAEDAVIDQRSQVTLPDGTVAPIEGLNPWLDETGALDHYEVHL